MRKFLWTLEQWINHGLNEVENNKYHDIHFDQLKIRYSYKKDGVNLLRFSIKIMKEAYIFLSLKKIKKAHITIRIPLGGTSNHQLWNNEKWNIIGKKTESLIIVEPPSIYIFPNDKALQFYNYLIGQQFISCLPTKSDMSVQAYYESEAILSDGISCFDKNTYFDNNIWLWPSH